MRKLASTAKKHILNFPGKKLTKKYIVFESDDWGSERVPSKKALTYLIKRGIDVYGNPFNNLDSLETEEDLTSLFETLGKFKDRQGRSPVITANSIVANPDFKKIEESGFMEYHYERTIKTYSNKKGCESSHSLIREGIASGLFHPQFHGREHLNVRQWLRALQSGNKKLISAFKAGVYGVDHNIGEANRGNFMAAFDFNSVEEGVGHKEIINEGVSLFEEAFGYKSKSFVAPTYVWHPSIEGHLKGNGINYLQGLPVQYVPVENGKYGKIHHYQGERNSLDQVFFVRNSFFEPALNPDFDWIDDCLSRLKIIFFWGKPAIIGTHRINFIGSLNEQNRTKNLKFFSELLSTIIKKWPDVEFTTTDKLGDLYNS